MEEQALSMLKEQMNIDFEEKDAELRHLLKTADAYTADVANLPEDAEEKNSPIYLQAVLLLARHWFETGGTMTAGGLQQNPHGYWTLVNRFYRSI